MIFWILHITALGLASFLSFRKLKCPFPSAVFWLGLVLKLTAGIILGLIFYEYYGSGDTIYFYDLATGKKQFNLENQPRTAFFIAILKPLARLTNGSYWIASLWLSFINFIACWYAVSILSELYPKIKNLIAASLLFIPSIVFWSSGVMKDTLAFAALVSSVAIIINFYKRGFNSIVNFILLILAAFILLKIKHYLLITMLLFGGALASFHLLNKINGRIKWFLAITVFSIALVSTQFVHPYLKITRIAQTIYENNQVIIKKSNQEDQLAITINDPSFLSVLEKVPKALHYGLFRPSILDNTMPLGWIHKIENLILTVLIFLSLLLFIKKKPVVDWPLFSVSILCIILLATLLPLTSPNLGTLVRYKNAFLPFLFIISGILPYKFFSSKTNE